MATGDGAAAAIRPPRLSLNVRRTSKVTSQPQTEPVTLKVSPDRMTVHACWTSGDLTAEAIVEMIYAEGPKLRLKLPEDRQDIHGRVSAAVAAGGPTWQTLLLSGTPTVPPVDERIAWERDFFSRGFKVDKKTGRIDYRERAVSLSVAEGEVLGGVVPGRPGVPGTDVCGDAYLPAAMKKADLRTGRNVKLDGETRVFTATHAGRLRLSENTLTVDDTYEVTGSVGLETGNIRFAGHLVVGDEIQDLAVVDVAGGVEVANVIGGAQVRSGGDITIGWGMAGGGKGRISAGGAVQAGYISRAEVSAEADVTVLKEIVQSDVRCRGAVRVEAGRIVGGQVVALGGIVAAEVGSEAGVPTLLRVGEDYTVPLFLDQAQRESDRLNAECEAIRPKLRTMESRRGRVTVQQKRTAADLASQLRTAEKRIAQINREVKERLSRTQAAACKEVRVLKQLHPQVTFEIGKASLTTDRSTTGPVLVKRDDAGDIVVLPQ